MTRRRRECHRQAADIAVAGPADEESDFDSPSQAVSRGSGAPREAAAHETDGAWRRPARGPFGGGSLP